MSLPKLLLALLLVLPSTVVLSQAPVYSGHVADTSEKKSLAKAVVSLLRAKDSVLIKFTRTDQEGRFQLQAPNNSRYLLLITYPGYAEYADFVEGNANQDLGTLNMLTRAVLLQNVIVRGSAVRMKGDTMAFVADSFKVREGATVEDLLKRLPGLSVNAKGEITAQGRRVEKVLVDGDEFFGDDPTLATRNLQANAVKEVQVFERKSDQATFTGVDDGQGQQTINLKLKDEFKRGYFGKVKLAGGLPNRWENQAMINAFKDKRKLSVYGIAANTNNNALGWSEESQFGGNMNQQTTVGDDGSVMMYSQGDEFGGTGGFYGEGLPTAFQAGTSYSNKWNENRSNALGAYRFQKLRTEAATSNITQFILPDTQFFNNQRGENTASRWRHRATGRSEIFIDSSQSLVFTANGSYGGQDLENRFFSEALTGSGQPVNRSNRTTTSSGNRANFDASALWRQKFKKKGRTLSINLSTRFNENESDGFLLTYNEFFKGGAPLKSDTTDQKKTNADRANSYGTRIAYSEPIGKLSIVEASVGYDYSSSRQERLTFDKKDGKYDVLNNQFSNDFKFKTNTQRTGLGYRYNGKKLTFGLGSDIAFTQWKQDDLFRDTTRNFEFVNLFPRANMSYKLGQYSRLRFEYNGNTQAPTANQLQPVADNTDPLNIFVGNPALQQAFNHRIELNYNFWKVLDNSGFWMGMWFSPTANAFSTRDNVDTLGRKIFQTVNVDGNYNLSSYMGYHFRIKKLDLEVDLNANPSFNRNTNFVNGVENRTNNTNLDFGYRISKAVEKKFYLDINQQFGYNRSTSSIRPDVRTTFWTGSVGMNATVEAIKNLNLNTSFDYNWRQRTEVFTNNNNAFIWNASAEYKVSKKKDLRLGIRVNDILNQNIGFRRNINTNFVSEQTYNVIRRFWMLTFQWNFNKGPQKVDSDEF
ncbi:MAG: outer membrane beta-barrel protein [Chitinophagaceae bacterium]|nr:outer membrane beta-barrel protein [Chitinophagaceae bacterium]